MHGFLSGEAIKNVMRETAIIPPERNYRPDIDGLRAVAVLAVVAWHLNFVLTPGGFVGVDVFFVISGYLISSIIFAEVANSRFSIIAFYERRIRRIFPALFVMFLGVTVFTAFCFLPPDFLAYSKSLLAATAFSSNFYFLQHSTYFDSPDWDPLLHTWSLAVEEQFYILFPIFLVLTRRVFPRRLRAAVVVLFAASLAMSAFVVFHDRTAAFYMPHTRAWELLLGTMLSLKMFPRLNSGWLRNLVTLIGVGMIIFAIVRYSDFTTFPGLSALLPCVGSALIIGSGESGTSLVYRALALRPVVFIGLISYSLYLWHWPIIIMVQFALLFTQTMVMPDWFVDLTSSGHLGRYVILFEVAASFALATLSWRFVERPFRIGRLRLSGKPLFALTGAVMLITIAFSTSAIFAKGFEGRFSPALSQLDYHRGDVDTAPPEAAECFVTIDRPLSRFPFDRCLHQDPNRRNYLVVGDSHAYMLWPAISASLPGTNVMLAAGGACRPYVRTLGTRDCIALMRHIYQDYLPTHPVQALVLISRWNEQDLHNMDATIEWAKQHQVPIILFGPSPEYDAPLPRLEAYSLAWNEPDLVQRNRVPGTEFLDRQFQNRALDFWHVPYVSLYRAISINGEWSEYADAEHRVPIMSDGNHLSPAGSMLVIHRVMEDGEFH
jgi:peptidoglycan/LPS O-acetylase OafA/YrhL